MRVDKMYRLLKRWGISIRKLLTKYVIKLLKILVTTTMLDCFCGMMLIGFIIAWYMRMNIVNVVSNTKMEMHQSFIPIILWQTGSFPGTSELRNCRHDVKCDVRSSTNETIETQLEQIEAFLFYASSINFDNLPLPRLPMKIIWGLYHEESPRNVVELMHDEALNLFNFSSTFSRHSDVPFPLQYLESIDDITSTNYFIPTAEKNKLHTTDGLAPVLYLQTDCDTSTQRDEYVQELMHYVKIDSYGKCLHNSDLPREFGLDYLNNLNDDAFLNFVSRYKFVLAIENGVCEDYITEKLWRAIKVGSVPIYFGSPSIRDWLPNKKAAVLLDDYPTPKFLGEYIDKLMDDDNLYESHLMHKTQNIITNQKLLSELKKRKTGYDHLETVAKFECFICEEIYKKRIGFHHPKVVDRSHYDCPEPISALSLNVNHQNPWVQSYWAAKENAKAINKRVMG